MATVFVSIGSNMEREKHIRDAVAGLRLRFGALQLSPIYETAAVGFDGPAFYNLVAAFEAEDLGQVKAELRNLESRAQRQRDGQKFCSRTLDIDILLFGDQDFSGSGVDIPRREILLYAFVLRPLADIAANLRHPQLGVSMGELWQQFKQDHPGPCETVRRIDMCL